MHILKDKGAQAQQKGGRGDGREGLIGSLPHVLV